MLATRRRTAAAVLLATAALGALLGSAPASAAPAALADPLDSALDWIEGELEADGGHLSITYENTWSDPPAMVTTPDWGLTIDAILALAAGGRSDQAPATIATDQVEDNIGSYVTGADFGAPNDRYAAPLGKALLVAAIHDADPQAFGGFDLVAELTARMQGTGADAGRFSDDSPYGDYSNGIGQPLAIMGLARTSTVPGPALAFLLGQQCPAGGFRVDYSTPGGCVEDAQATVDATGMALQALLSVDPTCPVRAAVSEAADWLLARQSSAGGFGAEAGANTNSTGLAGAALRSVGRTDAADEASGFITALQLTDGDDVGAIALNEAGKASAADGIQILERDSFRRATGQAVLALGLPSYGQVGGGTVDPDLLTPCPVTPPTTPVTPSVELSQATVTLGGSLTVTGNGFTPGEAVTVTLFSTPTLLTTATADSAGKVVANVMVPADLEVGEHRVELLGLTSGVRVSLPVEVLGSATSADPNTLPATGTRTGEEAVVALGLLALGAAFVALGRRRAAAVAIRTGRT